MRWKLTCRDAGDGSGDMILELPDDLLQAAGLAVGDTLEVERDPNDIPAGFEKKGCRVATSAAPVSFSASPGVAGRRFNDQAAGTAGRRNAGSEGYAGGR